MTIETPLIWLDKALGEAPGGAALNALIVEPSHSCYLGERGLRHAWGHGCGTCPACALRRDGWQAYVARSDPDADDARR